MHLIRQIADHAFGLAVHRGAIDHFAPELDETRQHVFERHAFVRRRTDIEDLPGPQTDDGNLFPS